MKTSTSESRRIAFVAHSMPRARIPSRIASPTAFHLVALLAALVCWSSPSHASPAAVQPAIDAADAGHPVWVFFTPRDVTDRELATTRRETPVRTLERRQLRGTATSEIRPSDLPVESAHIDVLRDLGTTIRCESRWLNGVSVEADAATVAAIAQLPFVREVRPVARWKRELPDERGIDPDDATEFGDRGNFYGNSGAQLRQLNLTDLHAMGFTGSGVVIGVLDTGFRRTHDGFAGNGGPDVIAEYDFINLDDDTSTEDGDAILQHCHGTYVLSVLAAYNPGTIMGAAFDASYILCKTEDTLGEYEAEEDYYVAGLEYAELHGADIVTASLGYIDWYTQAQLDGQTTVSTRAVNEATARGVICLVPAGNEFNDQDPGTSSLLAPADAPNAITVGGVNGSGASLDFTSDGPTADGRVKPEVLARGVNVQSVTCLSTTSYTRVDGTSFATPLVAGAVACLLQARPAWTVQDMREHLFSTASDFAATGDTDPLFIRGYGIVDALAAYNLSLCPGDVDGSGTVDFADLELVLERWGTADPVADLDASGLVDFGDLNETLDAWATDCD